MVTQLPEAVTDGLRAEYAEFMKARPDLVPADFAQYTTLAPATVRNFLSGHCPGGIDVATQMRRVLGQAKAGEILALEGAADAVTLAEDTARRVRKVARRGTFYETQTVRKIWELLDYCAGQSTIGVVSADFGVGKTEAVKEWRRRTAGSIESMTFEFDEFSRANVVDFVRLLAQQCGLPTRTPGAQHGGVMFRQICEYLRENPCLLIFDQCETVRARVCQVIRQIWDRTHEAGVGVALLAAPILLQRMLAGKTPDLGALTSRIGIWATLSGLTRPEMAAIVKQEGIGQVDAAGFDLWFKACAGSMRRLMRSLDLLKAKHAGRPVTEKTIVGVAAHLWGMNVEGAV
jgi:hypothetical protein